MTTLLLICSVLTAGLAVYSLGYYVLALVFVFGRPKPATFADEPTDAVSVLVAARDEGDRALRVITSLLEQDHRGPIEIYLLLEDNADTSVAHLERAYPNADFQVEAPGKVELLSSPERRVAVLFGGVTSKSQKINLAIAEVSTRFTAILDCDHQAHPDWLRTSLCLLHQHGAPMIQGCRKPLSARGFFRFWDSVHQHIGCELFNAAFSKLGLSVFFTGTTAVMETELLRQRPLRDCLTEDVDFSYGLFMAGVKIIHDPLSGSDEETSPDLYSFLARRRRWSNGHTEAAFVHLKQLWSAPVSLAARLQFLVHGSHYLVSLAVFALHLVIGCVFVQSLSQTSQATTILSSFILTLVLAGTQRTIGWVARISELVVLFGWMFPAVVIVMNLAQAVLMYDFQRAALWIPEWLQIAGLLGLGAPLFILLIGLAGLRQLNLGTFLWGILSYPLAFYLDISGVLLGLTDYIFGRARWRLVSRPEPLVPLASRGPTGLLPAVGVKQSWRLRNALRSVWGLFTGGISLMKNPLHWLMASAFVGLFSLGVLYTPSSPIDVTAVRCEALEHDTDPWIVPVKDLRDYCDSPAPPHGGMTVRTGSFQTLRDDDLTRVDPEFWRKLDSTFDCNGAVFDPENVVLLEKQGIRLHLEKRENQGKAYTSGSIATLDARSEMLRYGRFEAVLKPAKAAGVLTALFLYRANPWQEIDMEFIGRDTTKILLNVFYNPGNDGDLYNFGYRGTPVLIDLGFDAADDFHRYAFEWESQEIRWFVDEKLIHVRRAGRPTPIPQLPMRFYLNVWPCCSEELAGPLDTSQLPTGTEIKSIYMSRWYPPPIERFLSFFLPEEVREWRAKPSERTQ